MESTERTEDNPFGFTEEEMKIITSAKAKPDLGELPPTFINKIKGKMRGFKDFMSDKMDGPATLLIRQNWYHRWAELSNLIPDAKGKYDYSKINFDNEYIQLEWYLTDYAIYKRLFGPRVELRAEGLALIPDELHETM